MVCRRGDGPARWGETMDAKRFQTIEEAEAAARRLSQSRNVFVVWTPDDRPFVVSEQGSGIDPDERLEAIYLAGNRTYRSAGA